MARILRARAGQRMTKMPIRGARILTLVGVGLLVAASQLVLSGQEKVVAIRAGSLIDGTGTAPVANAVILVNGKRITRVGPNLPIPKGAEIVDLGRQTVLPGFIDVHTHVTSENGSERTLDRCRQPEPTMHWSEW